MSRRSFFHPAIPLSAILMSVLLGFVLCGSVAGQMPGKEQRDIDLPICKIMEKYYAGRNFYVGAAFNGGTMFRPGHEKELDLFLSELSYCTPTNSFKQVSVYTHPGAEWNADEYRKCIETARKNNMTMRCHGPISPQCSSWVKGEQGKIRTGKELIPVMEHYMTELSKDLEKNKDVVRWMDVVNETVVGTNIQNLYQAGDWFGPIPGRDFQNPWLAIGQDGSSDLEVPLYIIRAFELANEHAPSIKKLYNQHCRMEKPAWDKIKATIKFLRARGLKVDAIGWQAHVPLGWEKDTKNLKDMEDMIDWCYANDLEFHITELNVVRDPRLSKETAHEHAELFYALTAVMAKKVGKGAVGLGFWDFVSKPKYSDKSTQRGGLFDENLSRQSPQYLAVKRALLEHAPSK